jgi:hypothetical protein
MVTDARSASIIQDQGRPRDGKIIGIELSLYTILQILSLILFGKMPLYQAFTPINYINKIASTPSQLNLFES